MKAVRPPSVGNSILLGGEKYPGSIWRAEESRRGMAAVALVAAAVALVKAAAVAVVKAAV
jgi:hypothetical protein